ncbi:hypothetical protein AAD018_001080 [Aestuariibius insulae]|uniref:hypothetical protein n=1 Tax=Aestuariibius insulae TaxID=2058287 RepID=UPI00345E2791
MVRLRQVSTVLGTFGVAAAIGFIMQNESITGSRYNADESALWASIDQAGVAQVASVNGVDVIGQSDLDRPAIVAAYSTQLDGTEMSIGRDCAIRSTASVQAAALVYLSVEAPCRPQTELTVHHQGMVFSAVTDTKGRVALEVPALAEDALFITAFESGEGAMATAHVPEFSDFHRVVLQWQGHREVGLHALENGAGYWQDGHVRAEAPRDAVVAMDGTGGFITRLGDASLKAGYQAEIYTLPLAQSDVRLTVEARVTERNCGHSIAVQAFQAGQTEGLERRLLNVTMPDCDFIGENLILKRMLTDI